MFKKKYKIERSLWEITLACNMRCTHCGTTAGSKRKNELSVDEWKSVAKQLADMGCKRITIIGGEPFIHKNWYEIAKSVKDNNMELMFISNGFKINDEIIKKLKELNTLGVGISLDGGTANIHDSIRGVKGSFNKCKTVIKKLKKAGINVTVITTVHKKNFHDLPKIRDYLLNKKIAWQIQPAFPFGRLSKDQILTKEEFYTAAMFIATTRAKHSFKEMPIAGADPFGYFSKELPNIGLGPWKGCGAGISHVDIRSNGDMIGCLALPNEYVEGNIRQNSIKEIWVNPDSFAYNRKFKKQNLTNECIGCKYGKVCKGGCTMFSLSLTGEPHGDPYCLKLIEKSFKDVKKVV